MHRPASIRWSRSKYVVVPRVCSLRLRPEIATHDLVEKIKHFMDNRRTWAIRLLAAGGAIGSFAIGIPALLAAFSSSIKGRKKTAWRSAGNVNDYEIGKISSVEVLTQRGDWSDTLDRLTVFVWRQTNKQFVVFSRSCTDLSCPVTFDAGSECFFCPCHGGIFAKNGTPLAGPPKRALYRYATRIREEVLEIDLHSLPPSY